MIIITYNIGQRYADVQIVTLIIILVTAFLFIVSFIIVRAFEQVVRSRLSESQQAKEILNLKDQFVFIAVHELRTPANAIKWGLGSLRTDYPELTQKANNLLSIIERGNDRLLRLVKDMLEVARIESHTVVIKLEKVSIPKLIPHVETKLQSLADEQGVVLHFNLGSDLPLVQADAERLKEVLNELLTTTIKYSNKGDTITVSSEFTGTHVSIHVRANNMIVSDEDLEHIFEKFPESSTIHDTDETGLGLFIAKQLVELMSGVISCSSHPERGTVFSFSLHRADIEDKEK